MGSNGYTVAQLIYIDKTKRIGGNFYWEFPCRFVEKGELNEQAVIREENEELGISDYKNIINPGRLMVDSGLIHSCISSYLVNIGSLNNVYLQQSEKIVDYKLVSYNQMVKIIQSELIDDNFALASLVKLFAKKAF